MHVVIRDFFVVNCDKQVTIHDKKITNRDFFWSLGMALISVYFVSLLSLLLSLFRHHAKDYHAPSILHGLSRPGLSRLHHHCTATTAVYIYPGYHAIGLSSIPSLSHLSYHAPPHT